MVRDKEGMLFSIYEFILFNIKFHSLPGECLSAGGDGEKMGGVLKECSELRGFFERSKINPFCILRLKDVKGFVEGKIAEMDALREKDLE